MNLNSIEEIISDIRSGRMVVLMDDVDRENEGDLIIAAEKVTPETVNFMASRARGLICLTLTSERCDYLRLHPMVEVKNGSPFGTPFTVSIEAARGVTTGISAADRARTILAAVDPLSKPEDIVQPGHIFPLRAQPGGVLSRAGHTEAGCDLARLAGLQPSAAIVEIMNDDGTMARRPDLEKFAHTHGLKIGTIADLIHYRILNEKTVEKIDEKILPTEFGDFTLSIFRDTIEEGLHLALSKGEILREEPVLVRVQTADTLRDIFCATLEGSGSWSTSNAMKKIAAEGRGIILLLNAEEKPSVRGSINEFFGGRPSSSPSTQKANLIIGTGSQILRELNVGKMKILSHPTKYKAISGFDLEICEFIPYSQS